MANCASLTRTDQQTGNTLKRLRLAALTLSIALVTACNPVVLAPAGDVAARQRDILVHSTYLMLLIIVPVLLLIVFFAFRYRASNTEATYDPEWSHSTRLELVIWAAPLLIVICLGGLTWVGTHLLDPYRPLDRISAGNAIGADTTPLEVEVVALDWKWMFIYPQYGIATVNELAMPVDRPVAFKLTSDSVMNAFYIPTMAGMIYAMPGMQTALHGVINAEGVYDGFSSNYSGAGFSGMRFKVHATDEATFDDWIAKVQAAPDTLDAATYLTLTEPTENVPPAYFNSVSDGLYHDIVNMCVTEGTTCMDEIMMKDARTAAAAPMDHGAGHDMGGMTMDGEPKPVAGTGGTPTPASEDAATTPIDPDNEPPSTDQLRGHGLSRELTPFFGAAPATQDNL